MRYDLLVIGGGSGGVRAARVAAQNGARVAIIEKRYWGGTCVNVGCVPKKLMSYASNQRYDIQLAEEYGWEVSGGEFDWTSFKNKKQQEIKRLNGIYSSLLENNGVDTFYGHASFISQNEVQVTEETGTTVLSSEKIIIATGSAPNKLSIPGADHSITSDQFFSLEELPSSIAIVGAGFIGIEFAGILKGLGVDVHLIYRQDLPLVGFDNDVRYELQKQLEEYGIKTHSCVSPTAISKQENIYSVLLSNQDMIKAQCVLTATGRKPNIKKLNLEKAKVRTEDGIIKVDDNFETTSSNIYAIGDVTNKHNLTPTATAEAQILSERLFSKSLRQFSFDGVPKSVFFTQPISSVGLTEEQAVKSHNINVYISKFTPMKYSLSDKKYGKTVMKIITDSDTDIILGMHMIGHDSPEILQGFAVAVNCKITKKQLDQTIGIHPTSAEEFVTMRNISYNVQKKGA